MTDPRVDENAKRQRDQDVITIAVLQALWRPQGLGFLILVAGVCSVETSSGVLVVSTNTLAPLIFQVSGTIVALTLPAAELANNSVTKLADSHLLTIIKAPVENDAKVQAIKRHSEAARKAFQPAWSATAFALLSFLVSAFALLLAPYQVPLGAGFILWLDDLVTSVALGALLISALLFYPAARYAFNLRSIDLFEEMVRMFPVPAVPQPNEEAAGQQAESQVIARQNADPQDGLADRDDSVRP